MTQSIKSKNDDDSESERNGDEVLRRLLKTPPEHRAGNKPVNRPLTKGRTKQKPGGNPAKNNRPED